jgi:uncharacterized protein YuzE
MNKETILKHTASYEDSLLRRLKDPELAQAYLEAAVESYEGDGDTQALLLAMRDVTEAQGGIDELARCQHLINYDSKSGVLYFAIEEGQEEKCVEIAPGINIELDEEGKVIGIEILNASKFLKSVAKPIYEHV